MDKKIAVVTGASRGIGKAIASELIEAGYFVIASATTVNGVEKIQSELGESGTAFVLDLANKKSCSDFCSSVIAKGPVAVLVNNAGVTKDTLMLRMKDSDWDDVIEVCQELARNVMLTVNQARPLLLPVQRIEDGVLQAGWGRFHGARVGETFDIILREHLDTISPIETMLGKARLLSVSEEASVLKAEWDDEASSTNLSTAVWLRAHLN